MDFKFGCIMLKFDFPLFDTVSSHIEEDDVYRECGYCGIDNKHHITLMRGIHDTQINDKSIFKILKIYEPILEDITLHNVSLFESDNFDVLKFDLKKDFCEELIERIHNKLLQFPSTFEFSEYKPHCTIAFLKKGCGNKYLNILKNLEFKITPKQFIYSKSDGTIKEKMIKSFVL